MPTADRYGVIGHPIKHSRSPEIHAHFAQITGQALTYEAFDVEPERCAVRIQDFFASGGQGLNVTAPHKQVAVGLAHRLTPRAEQAGAVNTLTRRAGGSVIGDNTDGAGWVTDLALRGHSIRGRSILLLGAGGAARGLLGPLLDQRPASVIVVNRTAERARLLAQDFLDASLRIGVNLSVADSSRAIPTVDWVVHASALGHDAAAAQASAAWPTSAVGPATIACDLSYGEAARPFCEWARAHGAAACFDGLGMLIEQAAEAFALWRGVRPDTAVLRAEWLSVP